MLRSVKRVVGAALPLVAITVLLTLGFLRSPSEDNLSNLVTEDGPASIRNLDKQTHALVIQEGEQKRSVTIAPHQLLNNVCASDCMVEVEGVVGRYRIAARDKLFLDGGELSYADRDVVVKIPTPQDPLAMFEPEQFLTH